ncbi:restriction endonuclease subunit S [uncultured Methanobrevibacter sp.]|uniref:restriction endonuclease subunit S n=1 Tax=uncultured Methanobrevibacter sp. TaxID=253161 RepID=UPI0025F2F229|nr:restriction endonuclease subunit S [uncultured Methanobrevibacter sp.]
MTEEKLVPKLRFNGFDDEWIEVNIKNYSTIKGRIGWRNLKQSEYTESGPYLIAGKHITNGIINWEECDHLSMERYDESPEIALKIGDVIFSKDGSLGNPALIRELPDKATINGTMMLVRLHEKIMPNFFYQVLNSDSFFRLLHILKSGSSIPHIFQRDMENFKFKVPQSLDEQNKVSNFLEVVDKKIELLKQKQDDYQNFKKYLMQQIFAQKLRFKDENNHHYENWEQLQLKDIISLKGGFAFKSELFKDEGMAIIRISNISPNNSVILDDLVYYNKLENDSDFIIKKGELIIAMSGATTGKVAVYNLDYESYINQRVGLFKQTSDKLYYPFLIQYTHSDDFKRELKKTLVAGAQPNISKKEIESFSIKLPQYEEQEKIADLLSNLDLKINTIKNQNNELYMFKKSLLQQMFV